ncbi:AAA family ATPase [Hymenobacter sp. DH14]|uniref:AAA family ATPase n=1 Tax=Hymenobacter cyanobacteriorum TaxID=2926463 RepID=A0A9X2AHE6_9BACT|nr:AAA family ATPase [Hymenobacter cyanobacteriorum]MCI1188738.1 AAA family ATPase [Hymenobacter cyanobacteriorum]
MPKPLNLQGRPLYKLSMGTFSRSPGGRKLLQELEKRSWLSINEYCAGGQGELLMSGVQIGDYIYACAASTKLLGIYRIIGPWSYLPDELGDLIDNGDEWGYRPAELVARPVREDIWTLKDEKSWWAPSGYRTITRIHDLRTANRVLFEPFFDITIMSTTPAEQARKAAAFAAKFPNPNIILYGPPGTGKTHHTLELAYELLTTEKPASYTVAQQLFQEEQGKRIEFVTFHQSFSYEDFVQGIKPEVNANDQLVFKPRNGIFYEIARRAREEYQREHPDPETPATVPFADVFNYLLEPLIEQQLPALQIKMKDPGSSFPITDIGNGFITFRRGQEGQSINVQNTFLQNLYEGTTTLEKPTGTQIYYLYIVQRLWALAQELSTNSGPAHPQTDLLLHSDRRKIGEAAPAAPQVSEAPRNYVLIIDEINRANISKVFGELITLLEKDKRLGGDNPLSVTLPSGEAKFNVPANLYIIGTMNTADKSIALLDIALRRRFDFHALYPIYAQADGTPFQHATVFKQLNLNISEQKSRDFQIGHAYFMDRPNKPTEPLADILNKKVIPLLYEYFLNDAKKVQAVFKDTGVEVMEDSATGLLRYSPVA